MRKPAALSLQSPQMAAPQHQHERVEPNLLKGDEHDFCKDLDEENGVFALDLLGVEDIANVCHQHWLSVTGKYVTYMLSK